MVAFSKRLEALTLGHLAERERFAIHEVRSYLAGVKYVLNIVLNIVFNALFRRVNGLSLIQIQKQ